MKTNNFNFEAFKKGTVKATTKLGNPVKFITMLNDGRMLVAVQARNRIVEQGTLKFVAPALGTTNERYFTNGKKYRNADSQFDLVMEEIA